jgi:redox-sensitive bicupin YhaK (pirin superfamily)
MYQITRNQERHHFENNWLSTYWHFSFADYYDPDNVSFGPLRVFNDDTVQPNKGFDTHGHKEMEIVTYVLEGALEHRDSTGGHGIIRTGEVQRMTAGTGIRHSEFNSSRDQVVHLLQVWVLPAQARLTPGYEQQRFLPKERDGVFLPIVTGGHADQIGSPAPTHPRSLRIHQDATFYVSTIRPGQKLAFSTHAERRAYGYVISGELKAAGHALSAGDSVKIWKEEEIPFEAVGKAELLLIDLP